jgi:RHS repeat-associated protein
MQMQLASNPVLSQPPLAAMPQLSEKPHLGFATKKTAWNPGPNVCNFTVTLGLQVVVSENGVRKTYSARYYNPSTGRFMSRDPEDGKATEPASLHKYLYAGGDPGNGLDPTGRATMKKPAGGLGGLGQTIGEYLGIINDISIRVFVVTQVIIPMYIRSEEGQKAIYVLVSGSVLTIGIVCEYLEIASTFNQVSANMKGPNVHKPHTGCLPNVDSGAGDTGSKQ